MALWEEREKLLLHVPVNQQEEMEAGKDEISSSMPLSNHLPLSQVDSFKPNFFLYG